MANGHQNDHDGMIMRLGPNGNEMWRNYLQTSSDGLAMLSQEMSTSAEGVKSRAGTAAEASQMVSAKVHKRTLH